MASSAVKSGRKALKKARQVTRALSLLVLPKALGHQVIRGTLNLNLPAAGSPLRYQLARDPAELRAALALVQACFLKMGYAKANSSGIRLTPYHLLPRTLVVTVKDGARVIATLTIIPRGAFGLPLESSYELGSFLQPGARIVEISALAVDPEFRGQFGEVLYCVMKFMYHCNVDLLQADTEVIGINPRMAPLYEAVLLFQPIPGTQVQSYDFAGGAPVLPLHFDLRTAQETYAQVYQKKPPHLNLMKFFLAPPPSQFELPRRSELESILPQSTAPGLKEILSWDPGLLRQLTPAQWDLLREAYQDDPARLRTIEEARTQHAR